MSNKAKGRKDRYVMLSPHLLDLWGADGGTTPGACRCPVQPMTTRQLTRACHAAAHMAEIGKRVSPHTLRIALLPIRLSRTSTFGDPTPAPPLAYRWFCRLDLD